MKRLSLLCCLVMLLNVLCPVGIAGAEVTTPTDLCNHEGTVVYGHDETRHWQYCTVCLAEWWRGGHIAFCDAPNVCIECGYEGTISDNDNHMYSTMEPTENGHKAICDTCGKMLWEDEHWAWCDTPGMCAVCSYKGAISNVNNHRDCTTVITADNHQEVCDACGAVKFTDIHYSSCLNLGVCVFCGYKGEMEIQEHDGMRWEITESIHRGCCRNCDYVFTEGEHWAWCDNPSDCVSCGYKGEISNINHHGDMTTEISADGHRYICDACGTLIWEGPHYAYCDTPNVCVDCGYKGEIADANNHRNTTTEITADRHRNTCDSCGKITGEGAHWAFCDTPNECVSCGYNGVIANTNNHRNTTTVITVDSHQEICDACGNVAWEGTHYANCQNPGVCRSCGYEGVMEIRSHDSIDWEIDENTHKQICQDCGNVLSEEPHWSCCDTPNVCVDCGYKGEIADANNHRNTTAEITADGHRFICDACGVLIWEGPHWAYCDIPNECVSCGYKGEIADTNNHRDTTAEITTDGHWYTCDTCGKVIGEGAHWAFCDVPNECINCGYKGEIANTDNHRSTTKVITAERHQDICDACGKVTWEGTHYANCQKPGVCQSCGFESVMEIRSHDNLDWEVDESTHKRICQDCGEMLWQSSHWAECDDPVCQCGKELSNDKVHHFFYDEGSGSKSDGNGHWLLCSKCGMQKDSKDSHRALCTVPNTCVVCGAIGSIANIYHSNLKDQWFFDESGHWYECEDCGARVDYCQHEVDCTNPTVCLECGASYAEMRKMVFHGETEPWHNASLHGEKCITCGKLSYMSEHFVNCDDPTVCVECGIVVATEDAYAMHSVDWNKPFSSDGTSHWHVCEKCGEHVNEEAHWNGCQNPGVCITCGASCEGEVYHEVSGGSNDNDGHDELYCWRVCDDCGEVYDKMLHMASCQSPHYCDYCGTKGENFEIIHQYDWTDAYYDDVSHWWICEDCGEKVNICDHYESCIKPGECEECGAKGEEYIVNHRGDWDHIQFDENNHWYICLDCGKEVYIDPHYTSCDKPDVCVICGTKVEEFPVYLINHRGDWDHIQFDENNHWYICLDCGKEVYIDPHYASCDEPGVCGICGTEAEGLPVYHHYEYKTMLHDENTHWWFCEKCGEKIESDHATMCDNHGKCDSCGTEGESVNIMHYWPISGKGHDPVTHELTCRRCGEKFLSARIILDKSPTCVENGEQRYTCGFCNEEFGETIPAIGHDWGEEITVPAACTKEGSVSSECTVCGELTVEVQNALGHRWTVTVQMDPTCTTDGTEELTCSRCNATKQGTIVALGHSYGNVYTSQNNGTHAVFCETCGDQYAVECSMVSTEIGDMVCSVCPVCGYAKYFMKNAVLENLEGVDSVDADVQVVRVENAAVESVGGKPAIDEDTVLIVHETKLQIQIELPDVVQANVKMILAVSLLKETESVQPNGAIRLRIPCVEEEVRGLKLVLMCENGELIEIEYEIINGEIVFETDKVGVFLLMEARNKT